MKTALLASIIICISIVSVLAGFVFEARYGDPVDIVWKPDIPLAVEISQPVIEITTGGILVNKVLVSGGYFPDSGLPPRCRLVPVEFACMDWFEPGESDWDYVLAKRPRLKLARWQRWIARVEKGRQKP